MRAERKDPKMRSCGTLKLGALNDRAGPGERWFVTSARSASGYHDDQRSSSHYHLLFNVTRHHYRVCRRAAKRSRSPPLHSTSVQSLAVSSLVSTGVRRAHVLSVACVNSRARAPVCMCVWACVRCVRRTSCMFGRVVDVVSASVREISSNKRKRAKARHTFGRDAEFPRRGTSLTFNNEGHGR